MRYRNLVSAGQRRLAAALGGGGFTDPFGASVVLLLQMDGTDGGTDEVDESGTFSTFTHAGGLTLTNADTFHASYGTSLGELNPTGGSDQVYLPVSSTVADNLKLRGTPWTVECRIKSNYGGSGDRGILSFVQSDGVTYQWKLRHHSDIFKWVDRRSAATAVRVQTGVVGTAAWHEVAIGCDGSNNLTLYYDGSAIDTYAGAAEIDDPGATAGLVIGHNEILGTTSANAMKGWFQSIRVTLDDRYGGVGYTPDTGKWVL